MPDPDSAPQVPRGIALRRELGESKDFYGRLAFSPDGRRLAMTTSGGESVVEIWNIVAGQREAVIADGRTEETIWLDPDHVVVLRWSGGLAVHRLGGEEPVAVIEEGTINSLAYHAGTARLAAGSQDGPIRIYRLGGGLRSTSARLHRESRLSGHASAVKGLSFSPDGGSLASASWDGDLRLWEVAAPEGRLRVRISEAHSGYVHRVRYSPTGDWLASVGTANVVQIWDSRGRQLRVLEGPLDQVTEAAIDRDGRLLACASTDGKVRIWRTDDWEEVATLETPPSSGSHWQGLDFHPRRPVLATLGRDDTVARLWNLDHARLLAGGSAARETVHYTNAKVVLVGDSGVGKTGLGMVLCGEPWKETESTHGRRIWSFDAPELTTEDGHRILREILLWDLAGQPGYRLVHQLHLGQVALALLVFDARSETDPLSGVRYWQRALRQAARRRGDSVEPQKRLLVVARIDRGGVALSTERLAEVCRDIGADAVFHTSAKEGTGIAELAAAIRRSIDWDRLAPATSNDLFVAIQRYLVSRKDAGDRLVRASSLYRGFLSADDAPPESDELRASFTTCIGLLEGQGLLRRFSFGGLVLLQPELLDAYASAIVNAARDEPGGLGTLLEADVRAARFDMPRDERVDDREEEKLLLLATEEDLVANEIALLEPSEEGSLLIFPSQLTRENPDLPHPEGKSVMIRFAGPLQTVYSTLVVRLSHSGLFSDPELWRNAAVFEAKAGGKSGVWMRTFDDGRGEVTLFHDPETSEQTRFEFEEYVETHLHRHALPESIERRRVFACPECDTLVSDVAVLKRREQGKEWISCNVCDTVRISLADGVERLARPYDTPVPEMDRRANRARERGRSAQTVAGKTATDDFDVFLCHHGPDKPRVKEIGNELKEHGILPWLDEWELRPGLAWQPLLEKQIESIGAAAVFVGASGRGPWQERELDAFLREFVRRECPVIPVILDDASEKPDLPVFLEGMTWVDFRREDPDPMERLIWGITGERRPVRS